MLAVRQQGGLIGVEILLPRLEPVLVFDPRPGRLAPRVQLAPDAHGRAAGAQQDVELLGLRGVVAWSAPAGAHLHFQRVLLNAIFGLLAGLAGAGVADQLFQLGGVVRVLQAPLVLGACAVAVNVLHAIKRKIVALFLQFLQPLVVALQRGDHLADGLVLGLGLVFGAGGGVGHLGSPCPVA